MSLSNLVDPLVVDSVTWLTPAAAGRLVVAGSHGGGYSARVALSMGVGAIFLNDAGVGLNGAGIAGLTLLDRAGVPAACVGHMTARIGDGADMVARGHITHVNDAACQMGICPDMAASEALSHLRAVAGRDHVQVLDTAIESASASSRDSGFCVYDSASLVTAADAGALVVTGSHGGLPGPSDASAIKAAVRFAAFNDAGIGIDEAGISRLPALDRRCIAAVAVDAFTARIGDGHSTLDSGIISRANRTAAALGAEVGMPLAQLMARLRGDSGTRRRGS